MQNIKAKKPTNPLSEALMLGANLLPIKYRRNPKPIAMKNPNKTVN